MRAYQLWKLQPEWKWLQSLPNAPNAFDRSRLTFRQRWILDDFKIGPGIPLARFDALRRPPSSSSSSKLTPTPAPAQSKGSAKTTVPATEETPPPPPPRDDNFPDPGELASVIERLQRDLAAVTQERNQLRLQMQQQQQQQQLSAMGPGGGGARVFIPVAPAPPPPPPPAAQQTTDKSQVATLLDSLRSFDKRGLRARTPSARKKESTLTSTLQQAVTSRRRATAGEPDEDDDGEFSSAGALIESHFAHNAPGECQVCYSVATVQCVACKIATYCGEACQRRDWESEHQHACIPVSDRVTV